MKVRNKCQDCHDYKIQKRLPDYQVTFNHWCESFQTPCALVMQCDFQPKLPESPQKQEANLNTSEIFNIFVKKPSPSPPFID